MKIYCLSGLGVDERVFQNINIPNIELIHITWIVPFENESLADYSSRLLKKHKLPEQYYLLGVSFGGMIAQEIAKIQKPKKLFLISTMYRSIQLPTLFRVIGRLGIHKITPSFILKNANPLTFYFFGANQKAPKHLLKQILKDTNPSFLKWAISAIINWEPSDINCSRISIHGNNDKILKPLEPKYLLEDGGHIMIIDQANKIKELIKNEVFPYSYKK